MEKTIFTRMLGMMKLNRVIFEGLTRCTCGGTAEAALYSWLHTSHKQSNRLE
jgi:hypothetical protein